MPLASTSEVAFAAPQRGNRPYITKRTAPVRWRECAVATSWCLKWSSWRAS